MISTIGAPQASESLRRFVAEGCQQQPDDAGVDLGDTHKFESRYLDRLIGPLPEAEALYRQRSPIHHVDKLPAP